MPKELPQYPPDPAYLTGYTKAQMKEIYRMLYREKQQEVQKKVNALSENERLKTYADRANWMFDRLANRGQY